jgi:hypothetical protein
MSVKRKVKKAVTPEHDCNASEREVRGARDPPGWKWLGLVPGLVDGLGLVGSPGGKACFFLIPPPPSPPPLNHIHLGRYEKKVLDLGHQAGGGTTPPKQGIRMDRGVHMVGNMNQFRRT